MKPGYINIKRLLWAFILLLFAINVQAQTQTEVLAPMTGTPAAGEYYSKSKITLAAPFHFLPLAGQRLHLYIIDGSCPALTNSFSQNQNYIAISVPRAPMNNINSSVLTSCDVMQTVQYFDGLGRPLQTVQVKGSTKGQDIVQPIAYDAYGREAVKYLPYAAATADGSYQAGALTDVVNFYNPGGNGVSGNQQSNGIVVNPQPYAVTNFEPSPLNRVIEQGAPGTAWQPAAGHTNKVEYKINNQTPLSDANNSYLAVLYTANVNPNQSRTLVRGNSQGVNYAAGQLYVTISKDENWLPGNVNTKLGTTEEYKDKEGHVVLKRAFNMSATTFQVLSTYYVYDDLGNLAFVLPPKTNADSFQPNQTILDNLCYQYRYDERNRLSQKKIPGKGWEFMVYNKLDQVVFTQDSLQKVKNQYSFVKYDGMGRVIMTGLVNNDTKTAATVQSIVTGQTAQLWEDRSSDTYGYSSNSYPKTNTGSADVVPLTINYYDDYVGIPGIPAAYLTGGTNTLNKPTGLLTATSTAVLNTPADMLWTVNYYDDLGRTVKTYDQHYLGGILNAGNYDRDSTTYNFNNQPTTVTRQHFTTASSTTPKLTIANEYRYDHMGRKTKSWEQITNGNNAPDTKTLLSKTEYNEIGQVLSKKLHSTDSVTFRQPITYTYNERGWLRSSIAPLFQEELQYNTTVVQNGIIPVAQFNGNIASQSWGTLTLPNTKTYGYKYDQLNRLTDGLSSTNFNNDERNITYDLMGNVLTLERTTGGVVTDRLTYTYAATSNNLLNVNDGSGNAAGQRINLTNYKFDGNGNLIADDSKGITNITYNLLNLPQTITGKNTTYVYDATGQKLRRVIGTATTDYVSGIQYEGITGTSPVLSFIQTEEGRALPKDATGYNYEYSLTDHLGNSRVTFDSFGAAATAKQTDDYYPFGMDIVSGNRVSPVNNYLYNKKELQEDLKLYDYGARFYDPVIARWTSMDNKADHPNQVDKSPYAYGWNNPTNLTDPDGNCPICLVLLYYAAEEGLAYVAGAAIVSTVIIHNATSRNTSTTFDRPTLASDNTRVTNGTSRVAPAIVNNTSDNKKQGTIYRVPGTSTKSGKDYVGRHNKPNPQKTRKSNDGRDRTKAEVIDTYDPNKPGEGPYKEQKAIDDNGGVDKLDNKRREVSEKRMEEEKKKHDTPPPSTPPAS